MRIEHLWQVMFRAGFFPGDKVVCAAISAIDIALWDLKGKALGQPVHRSLGGPVRVRPVSTAAGTQLCLASTNVGVLEMALEPGTDLMDIFPVQTPFDQGYALPSAAPGLGIEFDEEAAARYPAPEAGFAPLLQRRDGAFTNW